MSKRGWMHIRLWRGKALCSGAWPRLNRTPRALVVAMAAVGALIGTRDLPATPLLPPGSIQRPTALWPSAAAARAALHARLTAGARVLVVSAHPDDETLFGPLLAEFCGSTAICRFAVLTRGEGGHCSRSDGCPGGLGAVRSAEMAAVARTYSADLQWGPFTNFPLTGGDEARQREILATWSATTDPVAWIRRQIAEFDADLILTGDGEHGFYGHPEHVLVGRLVIAALGLGAGQSQWPHARGRWLVQVLNRYWAFAPAVGRDPGPVDATWPTHRNCGGRPCMEVAVERALLHQSQLDSGIRLFRWVGPWIERLYLRITPVPPL